MERDILFPFSAATGEEFKAALGRLRGLQSQDWKLVNVGIDKEPDGQSVGTMEISNGTFIRQLLFPLSNESQTEWDDALSRLRPLQTEGWSVFDGDVGEDSGAEVGIIRIRSDAVGKSLVMPGAVATAGKPKGDSNSIAARPRILCVHGVGHQESDPTFEAKWKQSITASLRRWNPGVSPEFHFVAYDAEFQKAPLSAADVAEAFVKLAGSGIVHGIGDAISGLFTRSRGFGDVAETVRWTAGMVVQWAENDGLRAATREIVADAVAKFSPNVICAHSLGSLISYDTFARPSGQALLKDRLFMTFGSQIGNPFVRSTFGGRLVRLTQAVRWYHLYNPHDDAFAAKISLPRPSGVEPDNFEQVDARFDIEGMLDHDAEQYLAHPNTVNIAWKHASQGGGSKSLARTFTASHLRKVKASQLPSKPSKRALLVGINDYPDPASRLEGCVNDVFLMSSVLQECGFAAEDIRVVLNDRATAAGITERLHWLLDGAEDGQDRVFYYSGHGAQIPGYGVGETVEDKDECLVAYDFDWTREHAVIDDQFYELYSQLPYGTSFLSIFDCCHSGGLTRDGGVKARGLTPPDDIRHRAMRWDADSGMWLPRELNNRAATADRKAQKHLMGADGATNHIGKAARLRAHCDEQFETAKSAFKHKGPYMPILLQACQENQLAYEYRHGVTSYGAFTYSLSQVVRTARAAKKRMTWDQLLKQAVKRVKGLGQPQTPKLECPTQVRKMTVPW